MFSSTRITIIAALAIALLATSIASGQNSRSTLYQGDARVNLQESKEFEYVLKRGEQLVIQATGMDDEPISVFKVVDLTNGAVLTELNERKNFESRVTIPKDGPYQIHFFNNSSWIEKIFQIQIDIESPEGVVIASDRYVQWEKTRNLIPEKKFSGVFPLNKKIGKLDYTFIELKISEGETGKVFIAVGVPDVAKPWLEHLRSIDKLETFKADPLKAFKSQEVGGGKLGGENSVDWKLFTLDQWNAFAKGATVDKVAGSDNISAEITTAQVSQGTYILFIANQAKPANQKAYLEIWTHNLKVTKTLK